jgi:hypothetical protein
MMSPASDARPEREKIPADPTPRSEPDASAGRARPTAESRKRAGRVAREGRMSLGPSGSIAWAVAALVGQGMPSEEIVLDPRGTQPGAHPPAHRAPPGAIGRTSRGSVANARTPRTAPCRPGRRSRLGPRREKGGSAGVAVAVCWRRARHLSDLGINQGSRHEVDGFDPMPFSADRDRQGNAVPSIRGRSSKEFMRPSLVVRDPGR